MSRPQVGDLIPIGGFEIKSIQRGVITMTSETDINVNINSVDVNKSVIIVQTRSLTGVFNCKRWAVLGKFNSSTQINVSRTEGGSALEAWYTVIEFDNIENIQTGEYVNDRGLSMKIPINKVDVNKSIVIVSYKSNEDGFRVSDATMRATLLSDTEIDLYGGSGTVKWFVVEFN